MNGAHFEELTSDRLARMCVRNFTAKAFKGMICFSSAVATFLQNSRIWDFLLRVVTYNIPSCQNTHT